MDWYPEDPEGAYDTVVNAPHRARLSHELMAAAAAYAAMKAYDLHVARNGKPADRAAAREVLAALAGAFVDRMVQTKGLDHIDRTRVKLQAQERAETAYLEEFE
ncbi:DUF3759 domain-containing protein [Streptomyces sp. NPDC001262]|uniref:DUF3759 domain-containing protein n=1 Tax=unclassified Streptomyces TaxID=2593676 RepID=UPI0036A273E4